MFNDMYPQLTNEIEESRAQTQQWLREKLSEGSLVGFIVRTQDSLAVGSGCLWVRKEQPNPMRTRLEAPYLMSMFTEKNFRRRGVARLIVKNAIAWSRQHGYDRINLHATEVGEPLYEEFDFKLTNEMQLKL
jgi:GNAT superfamily N-acetyltransferase